MENSIEHQFKIKLQKQINLSHHNFYFYWKGRVALTAILEAIDIKKDDEIIVPAFTCVVVANAILYLGAKPIYVDIDLKTYNTSLEKIKSKVTPKTKAIICQNTFGLSSEIDAISNWSKEQGIISIEDCTHGFGGEYNQKPNGSYCDFAFYSTQWNKPFSTGIGGIALVNNNDYISALENVNKHLDQPTFKDNTILKLLILARKKILNEKNYWQLLKLYRFLSKKNIVIGSSSDVELKSLKKPKNYFKGMSKTQIKEGLKTVDTLPKLMTLRKNNAFIYTEFLKTNNLNHVNAEFFNNHSFLKYPLLVKNRQDFLELAEKNKIDLGEWFNSQLHPVQGDLGLWHLNKEDFPISKYASERMINLPTDTKEIEKVIDFLKKHQTYIINQSSLPMG